MLISLRKGWVRGSMGKRGKLKYFNPNFLDIISCTESGIDKSLALERKIESRKRNFSLDLENLIVPISLSTLDFREWQETILFLLSIFESGKNKFSFHSRFSRVARQISLSTLVFFLQFLRVHIESSTSFIADGLKLINLYLFQRSDITFSHMIWI